MEAEDYDYLMGDEIAQQVVSDPPYNLEINGLVGLGSIKHQEFAMASGEMSPAQFEVFLKRFFLNVALYCAAGAIVMAFMDWRHMSEILWQAT